jgi:hypothetical protein
MSKILSQGLKMVKTAMKLKVVVQPIPAKRSYYIVRCYESGRLVLLAKRVVKPEYVLKWFLYNQSLIDQGLVSIRRKTSGTIQIAFSESIERHFKVFLLHIYSVLNIRSTRKAECLARCWSQLDVVSPIIDVLWELSRITNVRRFSGLLRGYCLCR